MPIVKAAGGREPKRKAAEERIHGDGGEMITAAAREAFAERGYHAVSIRDIAKRAGVALSALYYYYPSKQELLYSLLKASSDEFLHHFHEALDAAGDDPRARFDAAVRMVVEYRVHRRLESTLLLTEIGNLDPDARPKLNIQGRQVTGPMAEIIQDGITAGYFTTPFPDDARRAIFSMCNAIARWYDPRGPVKLDELVARYQYLAHALVGDVDQAR